MQFVVGLHSPISLPWCWGGCFVIGDWFQLMLGASTFANDPGHPWAPMTRGHCDPGGGARQKSEEESSGQQGSGSGMQPGASGPGATSTAPPPPPPPGGRKPVIIMPGAEVQCHCGVMDANHCDGDNNADTSCGS